MVKNRSELASSSTMDRVALELSVTVKSTPPTPLDVRLPMVVVAYCSSVPEIENLPLTTILSPACAPAVVCTVNVPPPKFALSMSASVASGFGSIAPRRMYSPGTASRV